MHMICHATDLNGQTIQRLGAAAKISMDLGAEGRVLKGGFTAFGRKDSVNDHAGEGLGHGGSQGFIRDGHNPVGVEPNGVCFDRVSQGSANPGLEAARPLVLMRLGTLGMGLAVLSLGLEGFDFDDQLIGLFGIDGTDGKVLKSLIPKIGIC